MRLARSELKVHALRRDGRMLCSIRSWNLKGTTWRERVTCENCLSKMRAGVEG